MTPLLAEYWWIPAGIAVFAVAQVIAWMVPSLRRYDGKARQRTDTLPQQNRLVPE